MAREITPQSVVNWTTEDGASGSCTLQMFIHDNSLGAAEGINLAWELLVKGIAHFEGGAGPLVTVTPAAMD